MDNAIDLPTVTLIPIDQALLTALTFGLLLGIALVIYEIVPVLLRNRLNIDKEETLKVLAISFGVGIAMLAIFTVAMNLFLPPRVTRIDQLEQSIATLGNVQFCLVTFTVTLVTTIPAQLIKRRILD